MTQPTLTPWPGDAPPSEADLEAVFQRERLRPRWWSNAPGDRYASHSHPYHKVLYCARGSIRFRVEPVLSEVDEPDGPDLDLSPGDRLDIPPGVSHSALVGPHGVTCVEAPRP